MCMGKQMRIKILILVFYISPYIEQRHRSCFKNWNEPLLLPMQMVSCRFELKYPINLAQLHISIENDRLFCYKNQEFGDVDSKMKTFFKGQEIGCLNRLISILKPT